MTVRGTAFQNPTREPGIVRQNYPRLRIGIFGGKYRLHLRLLKKQRLLVVCAIWRLVSSGSVTPVQIKIQTENFRRRKLL